MINVSVTSNSLLLIRPCNSLGRKLLRLAALGIFILSAISATATAKAPDSFLTAAEHAGMAAQAEQLGEIHQHLQHVLNCLEGSTGKDFKASAGNPCTGKGALQALPKGSINLVRARKAIALARVGVKLHDVPPAHYVSLAIHAILTEDQQRREKVKE